jgi:hypothetical protein
MSLSAATVETLFRDLGLSVRQCRLYGSDIPDLIEANSVLRRTQLDSGDQRLETLGRMLEADRSALSMIAALVNAEVAQVEQYVRGHAKTAISAKGYSASDILAELADRMQSEVDPKQYVLRNEVALDGSVAADPANAGDGTLDDVVLTQLIAAQRFTVRCVSASVEGAEVWSVAGSVVGTLDNATTGVDGYADTRTGLEFTITAGSAAFAVGDTFYFYTSCVERRFQSFFRDHFRLAMPSAASGSETIDEDWAA